MRPGEENQVGKKAPYSRSRLPLLILLAVALGIRVWIFQRISPRINTDSITYLVLKDVDTVRTPGYPLFIEAVQFFNDLFSITSDHLRLIIFVQMFVLGLLNTWLIYKLAKLLTGSQAFSVLIGLIFNLDYFVTGSELLILTETLAMTLLWLTLFFYSRIFEGKRFAPYLAGFFSVWLLLTRPTYIAFFAALLGFTFIVHLRPVFKEGFLGIYFKPLLIFCLISIAGIGAWSLRNKIKYDYFGISTLLPYQLSYYTESFYDKYKMGDDRELDRYARILIEEKGQMHGFDRRLREMKIPDPKIASILMKLNLKLIKDNPRDYLRIIPKAASDYFSYSWYWTTPHNKDILAKNPPLARFYRFFQRVYSAVFTNLWSLLALIVVCPFIVLVAVRNKTRGFHLFCLLEGAVLYNFLISVPLTNAGVNNMRFRVPVEPLMLMIGFGALFLIGRAATVSFKEARRRPII